MEYVSPLDERVRLEEPLADRRVSAGGAGLAGRHVVLLDINKNRGAELLDRLEVRLQGEGATTSRAVKEIFSKPASPEVIAAAAERADLVVEGLAD